MLEPSKRKFSSENTVITCPVLKTLKQELRKKKLTKLQPTLLPKLKPKHRKLSVGVELTAKEKLRVLALETPEGEVDKKLERKILKLIPAHLIEQFPETYEQLFKDVKEEYEKFIKYIGADQKVRASDVQPDVKFDEIVKVGKKLSHETIYSYDKFNTVKYWLEKRLFITTPLIRKILNMCQVTYRETLFSFESYRTGCHGIQVAVLRARIREDIQAAKVETLNYICDQTNLLVNSRKYLQFIDSELFTPYSKSVIHYLSLNVMQGLYRTIQNFVHVLEYPEKIPLLKFNLSITNELDLVPNFEQLFELYHGIIDLVTTHSVELFEMKQYQRSEFPRKINIQVKNFFSNRFEFWGPKLKIQYKDKYNIEETLENTRACLCAFLDIEAKKILKKQQSNGSTIC